MRQEYKVKSKNNLKKNKNRSQEDIIHLYIHKNYDLRNNNTKMNYFTWKSMIENFDLALIVHYHVFLV